MNLEIRSLALAALALGGSAAVALLPGCAVSQKPADWALVREITPHALDSLAAVDPAVAADDHGGVAVTWVTRGANGRDAWLAVSRDSGVTFSAPQRLNPRAGSVSSYPEGRPAAAFGPAGALAMIWAERRPDTSGAVDVVVRASGDGGATLGAPAYVNDDRTRGRPAYHGFPAIAFRADGSLFATWLDERDGKPSGGEPLASSLYAARSLDGGQTWSANVRLVDSVCSCCRPAIVTDGASGVAIAYRAAKGNLRDPALAVSLDGGATVALDTVVSADRWYLEGCPDVGAGVTWNRGAGGTYAWFTGAQQPGVYLIPWHSGHGPAGVRRALADSLAGATHPRLAALGASTLIGVEARPRADTTRTVFAVRVLDPDGRLTPWTFLGADAGEGWLVGVDARSAVACWTENEGERHRVRVVRLERRLASPR